MKLIVDIQKDLLNYSLEVAFALDSETLGILGSSGSGKSMTLRCIAGIETPTRGTIILNDRILYDSRKGINLPSRQRKVGFLFQNYALFPHLTVAQNIAYGLKGLSKSTVQQKVTEQLQRVKLSELSHRYPQHLSGGQQQRAALARALATEPSALLLDEPFSALDTHLRAELEKELIKTLADYHGLTLFVSHNLEEAYRVCQRLLVFSQGKVLADAEKQAIFDNPNSLTVAQLTGCKNYSRLKPLSSHTLYALDWHCQLKTNAPILPQHTHIGIRAHHFTFSDTPNGENTFPCWVAWTSETPHRVTLYLKVSEPPRDVDDYYFQAEVFKEKWETLKTRPFPWWVCLKSERLLLLNE